MKDGFEIKVTAKTDEAEENLEKTKEKIEDVAEESEESSGRMKEAFSAIGGAVGGAFKAVGAAVAAGAAALVGLAESTREYRTEQAKLDSAFIAAGSSAEQATATYNDLYRVLGDGGQATEAAAHLAKLTTDQQSLSEWTTICQGVYATFGDSLPIEGLAEAANETAKVGSLTGGLADALNWAGVNEEEFQAKLDACNSEAEREALIRETLTGIYGDAAAAYEETAGAIMDANMAQAILTDAMGALGGAAEPVVTLFKSTLATAVQDILPHLETVTSGLQDVINGVDGGAEKMSAGISAMVESITNSITELLPTLIEVGVTLITSLLDGILSALPGLITAIVEAIPQLIQGIVDAFTTIVEYLPGIIEAIVQALPTLIPALINGIVDMVLALVDNFTNIINPIIDALPDIIISLVDAIMSNLPRIIEGLITLILAIVQAIPQIIQALVDALPTVISSIISGLLGCLPQIIMGLIDVTIGIVKALPQIFASLIEGIINTFIGIWDGIKNVFNAGGFGDFFNGLWTKIKNIFSSVKDWFKNIFSGAWDAIKNVFSGVGNFFTGIWDKIKSIFSKVGTAIADAVSGAFKKAVNWVLEKAIGIINGFIKAINFAIDVINYIPGVSISKLKLLDVPKMAKGGIVDKATLAMIGENGKEAVVPLENNTEWIDKLASKINGATGGGAPIYLQVDGKTFAELTVDGINKLTRQRGSLPLVMA